MEQKNLVILISGKQGSGKTTLANNLEKSIKENFSPNIVIHQLRFAEVIYKMHDAVRKVGAGYGLKPQAIKDGELLQYLGTEWGREKYGINVWVNCLKKKIELFEKSMPSFDHIHIVSDCRVRNEFDLFPDAISIRLECDVGKRIFRCEQWRGNAGHHSEINLDKYSFDNKFDINIDTGKMSEHEAVYKTINKLIEFKAI